MSSRQAEVLDLLPVLLHLNHPQLPGFVDHTTPSGIEFYVPPINLMEKTRSQFKALPKQLPKTENPISISALYLMGSLGSLAQSKKSDLDLWLCLRDPLDDIQLNKLERKCRNIEIWAEEQGVELHIFVMNMEQFKQGQTNTLDTENCGSSQHQLLLDEFYRASIVLAGRMPRWWLIPLACESEQEAEKYWRQLIEQRLINQDHWIDLGHLSSIPAGEFLGAGLWQLSKGLKSPYKSLLKLLLYRQYAEQFGANLPLCQELKTLVHQGKSDPDSCDPYVHLLQKVLSLLPDPEQLDRANLIRRAFYLKAGIKLSFPRRQLDDWRRQPLENLVKQWGWSQADLIDLDNQDTWTAEHVFKERNALVAEMLGSYRALVRFNQKHRSDLSINAQDIQHLGHQLTAAFDSRPGKVQNINPGIVSSLAQDSLTLMQFPGVWQLATGRWPKLPPDEQIIKQTPSLVELLAFCWKNGLIQRNTRLYTLSGKNPIERYELLQLSASIGQILRSGQPIGRQKQEDWSSKARPASIHLFINVAHDPMAALTQTGKQRVSNQTDPLSFGIKEENLIQTLDVLMSNSWGEWEVIRFTANKELSAVQRLVEMLLPLLKDHHVRPTLEIHCYSLNRAAQIRVRLNELIHQLLKHIRRSDGPYLFKLGTKLGWIAQQPSAAVTLLSHQDEIWPQLEQPPAGPIAIDTHMEIDAPLEVIGQHRRSHSWQLFYYKSENQLTFYLMDQEGALLREQIHQSDIGFWMLPTLRMLSNLRNQWLIEGHADIEQLEFYELIKTAKSTSKSSVGSPRSQDKQVSTDIEWRCLARTIPESAKSPANIELRAMFDIDDQPTLYCNMQEFSIWRWGDQLYTAVANHILSLRKSGQGYPIYLSGISFSHSKTLIEHWRMKRDIEKKLTKAIAELEASFSSDQINHSTEQDFSAG